MIIISWDVGIIHLAYCVLKYEFDQKKKKSVVEILDWDEINLIEDDRIKMECCGDLKAKKGEKSKKCGKNALYYLSVPGKIESCGFCKTHLLQHDQYWSQKNTEKLFRSTKSEHSCNYLKKNGLECGKTSKYVYDNDNKKIYYCTTHYKSELNKKIKEYSPLPIKNLIVKKYPTSQLQLNLIKKLDSLSKKFAKLKVEEVIIENQPSQKNPKMKSIANTLFDYFLIRGYIDKIHNLDIKLVRFMCPSNKLKVNNDNTIEVLKGDKDGKQKYKLTKALGIQYTKQLINTEQLNHLNSYKKQDDLCDSYLQGRYYLEIIRNKQNIGNLKSAIAKKSSKKTNSPQITKKSDKKYSGSKSSKKTNSPSITKKSSKTSSKKTNSPSITKKSDKKYSGSKSSKKTNLPSITKKSDKKYSGSKSSKKIISPLRKKAGIITL